METQADHIAGALVLLFMYVCGGLHGFSLGWLQPVRIRRVAARVERAYFALTGDGETFCGLLCDRFHPCRRPGCEYVTDPAEIRAADAALGLRIGLAGTDTNPPEAAA